MLIVILTAMPAAAVEVKLSADVEVTGTRVTLGEVARLTSGSDEAIAMMEKVRIGELPASGSTTVTLSEVRRALFAAGFNMAEIEMSGASRVEVKRAEAVKPPKVTQGADTRIVAEIRRFIAGQKGVDEAAVDVELTGEAPQGVPETGDLRLVCLGPVVDEGEMGFEVRARVQGESPAPVRVTARVHRMATAVVARRTLVAGAEVDESDIEVRSFAGSMVPAGALKDATEAVGARLSRRIEAGGVLMEADIARMALVRRGDECTVVVRGKGYHIVTKAVARDDGALGDEVHLEKRVTRTRSGPASAGSRTRRETTRERFTGVVTGHRRVEIQVPGERQ
jgi:flagella basal body P-ring formation protein FlgA